MEEEKKLFEFLDFVWESDAAFYEKYLVNLNEEELKLFLKENPDFKMPI